MTARLKYLRIHRLSLASSKKCLPERPKKKERTGEIKRSWVVPHRHHLWRAGGRAGAF